MKLDPTEEQQMIQAMAREFAETAIRPVAAEIDREGRFPHETVKRMGELGLMGVAIPEPWGGSGADTVAYVLALEEIAKACGSHAAIMSVNNSLYCDPVYKFGTDAQRERFLRPAAAGHALGGFALSEPQAGSDARNQQTLAVRDGGHYVLNGRKQFVTNGREAAFVLVFCATDRAKAHRGITALVVEKGTTGFLVPKTEDKLGIRASDTAELVFEDCRVPTANRLGEEGMGFKIALATLDGGRVGIAAQAVGLAAGAFERSVAYARERKSFGVAIGQHQMVQWMLADMATAIDGARLLTLRAAGLKDKGRPYTTAAAMAKLFAAETVRESAHDEKLGYPGEYPFTRGVYPTMYRGRVWTMRMFAGFGRPEDTNARFKYLLAQGQTGLSTAFDMPALMGYDADHPRARGEVGREGVSISTLDDFERLFDGIPLGDVTTSMTINCTASIALAMYLAVAEKQGVAWSRLGGTMQNDMLKEFIAQKEWICPPEPAVRIVTDMIEFTSTQVPRFNPVSISGYHIREAGSTAVQELAFTLADGLAYVEAALARGLDVDSFAPRLSFFFDIHNDFFEEIAKLRAARRVWARFMKERYGAKKPESMRLRTHTQTAGVSATAQQPLNNIARVAIQALAAVLRRAQSRHTNSYDETWALPTEEAVTVALRTQQILAEETGVALTVDPLGGSYFLETLTDQMEGATLEYIRKIDAMGGMIRAIDAGYPQKEIADAAYRYQLMDDRGEKVVVGVNKYVMTETRPIAYLRIDEAVELEQIDRVRRFKASRDMAKVERSEEHTSELQSQSNLVCRLLLEAVKDYASLGEISDVYRQVFGLYREPIIF